MTDKIIRILLIEDNLDDARAIRQMLADTTATDPIVPAFDLTRARRLSSGLRRLAAEGFDALLLDLSLPDSQGLDTLVKAQAQAPRTPIVVLSDLEKVALEAVQKGAQDYLIKGETSAGTLVRAIRCAIERKRLEARLGDSQAELAAVVENAPLVMLVVDQEVLVQKANRAAIRFAGHSAEEMIGRRGGEALRCLHHLDDPKGCGFGPSCKTCAIRRAVTDTIEKGIRHTQVRTGLTVVEEGVTKDLALLISTVPLTLAEKPMVLLYIEDITERKLAEKALSESEEKYRFITEKITDAVWLMDMEFKPTFISPSITCITGYTLEELQALSLNELLIPESFESTMKTIATELTPERLAPRPYERSVTVELESRRKDGSPLCMESTITLLRDSEGHPTGFMGVGRDVTERKLAQEAYRASVSRFRELFNKAAISLCFVSKEREMLHFNAHFEKTFGYSHEEVPTLNEWWQLAYPDPAYREWVIDTCYAAIQRAVETESDIEPIEYRVTCKSGDVRTMVVYGSFIGDELLLTFFDITERKQAEGEIRASETRFRTFVDHAADAFFLHEGDEWATILDVNRQACESLGYSREELVGMAPHGFDAGIDHPFRDQMRERLDAGEEVAFDTWHRRKDGTMFPVEVRSRPFWQGERRFAVSLARDITERKRVEDIMQARLRLLEFASSHSTDELLTATLDEIEALTGSSIGFYHFLGADQRTLSSQNWSTNTLKNMCTAEGEGNHYDVAQAGVWVDCVHERRPVIHNDYASLPHRKGMPEGHAPVVREVVVPIFRGDQIKAIIGVGNKTTDYDENDIESVSRLGDFSWDIIERKQAQEALTLFRSLIDQANDIIEVADLETGRFLDMNERACLAHGYTREEYLALTIPQINAVMANRPWKETVEEVRRSGSFVRESRHRRKDGSTFPVEININYVRLDRDYLLSVVRDITERKRAEEAVRESETRYRAIVEAFDGLIYVCSQDYRVEFMNKQLLERTGYDGTGELCYKVLHDLDSICPWCVNDRVFTGETVRWEVQSPKDDRWYYVVNTPIYHADGSMSKQAMILDITERKRAEEALRQSEERFRALYEDNPSMYFMVDAQGTVLSVNPFGADQLGYAVEELIGQSVLNVFYPDDWKAVQQQLAACLEHPGQVAHWELRRVRQDGSMLWVREAARAVQGADGRPVVLVVCEDITERRQAEVDRERLLVQVQEQAHRVQEIMDTVPEGVLLLDAGCRVVLTNPLGQEDLVTLANVQVGDILTRLGDRSLAELLTSPPRGLWHEVTTESRSFQAIARPIEDGPTPKGWVLVIRDVTQQREVEGRVQQQEQLAALGQLAAGIAHDFNNILAVISLYAGMSLRVADLPPLVYKRLEIVDQQARRASDLVLQVLDFSRRAVLERGAMDLLTFLKEQVNLLKRTLPESIEVKLVYGKDEYAVNADPTRMQQVVVNLATNARDAMPEGGRLDFGLERIQVRDRASAPLPDMGAGDWVCVTITDAGVGIPPDVLPHIFEPFFTTKAAGSGTGLGLAQVYGIIKQHEGAIDVKTEVGAGTTFVLYLPALVVPQLQPSPSRMEQLPQGHGETVLVVEDDAVARQAVVSGLEMLGYQVLQAANGQEALAVFERHADRIELVLSDVVMPEMGGRSLFHTLRQRDPAVRVVLLTGYPLEDKEFRDLRALGLREWALKPLSIEQLAQITARALGDVGREQLEAPIRGQ